MPQRDPIPPGRYQGADLELANTLRRNADASGFETINMALARTAEQVQDEYIISHILVNQLGMRWMDAERALRDAITLYGQHPS